MKYLVETHFHTSQVSLCGKVDARDGIRAYKNAGYSAVMVTDHISQEYFDLHYPGDTYKDKVNHFLSGYRAAKELETEDFKVLLGMELRFPGFLNDYLIFGLTEEFLFENEGFASMNLEQFKQLCSQKELTIIQAHPFREHMTIVKPTFIDGMEIFNGNRRHYSANEFARLWAQKHELITTAGSDFHKMEEVGRGGLYLDILPEDSRQLRRELMARRYTLKTLW